MRILILLIIFSFGTQYESFGAHKNSKESSQIGKRKKNGSYKKRKGIFKRIFKGKNACDCPKH